MQKAKERVRTRGEEEAEIEIERFQKYRAIRRIPKDNRVERDLEKREGERESERQSESHRWT